MKMDTEYVGLILDTLLINTIYFTGVYWPQYAGCALELEQKCRLSDTIESLVNIVHLLQPCRVDS